MNVVSFCGYEWCPLHVPHAMNGKGGKSESAGNGRDAPGANNDGTDREIASEMEDLEGEDISSDEDEEANVDHHVRPAPFQHLWTGFLL